MKRDDEQRWQYLGTEVIKLTQEIETMKDLLGVREFNGNTYLDKTKLEPKISFWEEINDDEIGHTRFSMCTREVVKHILDHLKITFKKEPEKISIVSIKQGDE